MLLSEQISTPREDRVVPQTAHLDNARLVLRGLEETSPSPEPGPRVEQQQLQMDLLRDIRDATRLRIAVYEEKILRHSNLRRLIAVLGANGLDMPSSAHALIPSFYVDAKVQSKPMPLPQHGAEAWAAAKRDFALRSYLRQIDVEFARISVAQAAQSEQALLKIDHALSRWGEQQLLALDAIGSALSDEIERLTSVPNALGVEPQFADLKVDQNDAIGGPFVPVADGQDRQNTPIDPFDVRLETIEFALAKIARLGELVSALPIRHPISDAAPITSRFGPRRDPFTGRKAMHQGIDFRAVRGTPVLAAGAGKVIEAGRRGGYGKLVVINHGNGLSTRYGHLHRLSVSVGDTVEAGDTIGGVGSTGRSTGPHLHYEVRRDGTARNPISFISLGATL
ncbi:MAG: M23 family metallopeptidase [Pseudomonadota bacterium]